MTVGSPSVNDTGAAAPSSAAANRLRNPDPNECAVAGVDPGAATGIPASTLSWVSKWLRVRSSVPANGMNASWPFCQSGSIESFSAGWRPQAGGAPESSASADSGLAASGRGIAIVGRAW